MSHLEVNIGDINSKSSKTKSFCVISLVDGTLELKQIVRYQIVDSRSKSLADSVNIEENATHKKLKADSNVTLEYIENAIHKSKRETIVIPCVAEFGFLGQFFTLNKQPLIKAVKHEDFLFQIELLIKSTEIDILDIFLITVSSTMIHIFHLNSPNDFMLTLRTITSRRNHMVNHVENIIDHINKVKRFMMFFYCMPNRLRI